MRIICDSPDLCFDDVLLEPQYSNLLTRKEVSLTPTHKFLSTPLNPIISSPMDTITETEMAGLLAESGGVGIIHRYLSIEKERDMVIEAQKKEGFIGFAVGATGDFLERAQEIISILRRPEKTILCIDIAYANSRVLTDAIRRLTPKLPDNILLMTGNIATSNGYKLIHSLERINLVRVGIGGGSVCSTRIKTGHGIPTLTSIIECKRAKESLKSHVAIVGDGGIRSSGDCAKAIAAGADYIMLGHMLASSGATPGEIINKEGKYYKTYRGMASYNAQKESQRSNVNIKNVEGVQRVIDFKGPTEIIINDILDGLRSACSYSGQNSLEDFQKNAIFRIQSVNSVKESYPLPRKET